MRIERVALAMGVIGLVGVGCGSAVDQTQDSGPRVTELNGGLRGVAVHFTAAAYQVRGAALPCVDRADLMCQATIWEVTAVETLSSCPVPPTQDVIVPGGDAVMAFQILQRGLSDNNPEATPTGTIGVVFGMQRDNPVCGGGVFDFVLGNGTFTFNGPLESGIDGTLNASVDGGALAGSVVATRCDFGANPFRETLICQ